MPSASAQKTSDGAKEDFKNKRFREAEAGYSLCIEMMDHEDPPDALF